MNCVLPLKTWCMKSLNGDVLAGIGKATISLMEIKQN